MANGDNSGTYQPDFELVNRVRGPIREENWAEYEAKGFGVLWDSLDADDPVGDPLRLLSFEQYRFGSANVFTGDAYDREAGRPLRHKPGIGIYVSPEGIRYWNEHPTDERHGPLTP